MKAGKNRSELENAIAHYKKISDPLKIKALYFLIANMDIHYSADYFWVDARNQRVDYNELLYPDFKTARNAFDDLKGQYPQLHPQEVVYKDIACIKADYLVNNIDNAFNAWRANAAKKVPFDIFCEYILPYRISIEPLQEWRTTYSKKYGIRFNNRSDKANSLYDFVTDQGSDFINTFNFGKRQEPLPRLGSLQLIFRKSGACEDLADFKVFILRSLGLPAWVDYVPYWATSSGTHSFAGSLGGDLKPISLDIPQKLKREPSKIIRETYAKQPGVLAGRISPEKIPPGFMRMLNYKDVTRDYWATKNLTCRLLPSQNTDSIVYACVFNFSDWKPTWWGRVKNQFVVFTDMSKGVIYLPAYYNNGKLKAAGYPVALGFNHELELKPDFQNIHTITINSQSNFLTIRPNQTYRLYYWDNSWILINEISTGDHPKDLTFQKIPANALLLLRPSNSKGKERPFIVTNTNQRIWW